MGEGRRAPGAAGQGPAANGPRSLADAAGRGQGDGGGAGDVAAQGDVVARPRGDQFCAGAGHRAGGHLQRAAGGDSGQAAAARHRASDGQAADIQQVEAAAGGEVAEAGQGVGLGEGRRAPGAADQCRGGVDQAGCGLADAAGRDQCHVARVAIDRAVQGDVAAGVGAQAGPCACDRPGGNGEGAAAGGDFGQTAAARHIAGDGQSADIQQVEAAAGGEVAEASQGVGLSQGRRAPGAAS